MKGNRLVALMTSEQNKLRVLISRDIGHIHRHTYMPTKASAARLDMWAFGKHNHIVIESGGPVVYINA